MLLPWQHTFDEVVPTQTVKVVTMWQRDTCSPVLGCQSWGKNDAENPGLCQSLAAMKEPIGSRVTCDSFKRGLASDYFQESHQRF